MENSSCSGPNLEKKGNLYPLFGFCAPTVSIASVMEGVCAVNCTRLGGGISRPKMCPDTPCN